VLIRHALLTESPRAAFLLNAGARLPIKRVQPAELPCSIEQTWMPILARLTHSSAEVQRRQPRTARPIGGEKVVGPLSDLQAPIPNFEL
jgi:hypothetical protein